MISTHLEFTFFKEKSHTSKITRTFVLTEYDSF